jgi:hypothetical protein
VGARETVELDTLIDSVHFIAVAPSDNNRYGWRLDTVMNGLSMPHLFFETDETHFGIPDSSMLRVLRFFDSVFVHSPASVQPRAGFNAKKQRPGPCLQAMWRSMTSGAGSLRRFQMRRVSELQ